MDATRRRMTTAGEDGSTPPAVLVGRAGELAASATVTDDR